MISVKLAPGTPPRSHRAMITKSGSRACLASIAARSQPFPESRYSGGGGRISAETSGLQCGRQRCPPECIPARCNAYSDDVDVQRQQRATELGHAVAPGSLLAVHPEDAVLVAVERHRLAMRLQIAAGRPEVIKRRFRGDEPQLHQPARRVIHKSQQRAWRAAILKPGVLRALALHQLAPA